MCRHTYYGLSDPHSSALAFSAILAADKGWRSEVVGIAGIAFDVMVEDGTFVRFSALPAPV